ncbi:hypothetical protein Taro_005425 [Colocasia esculenta]|uniref:Uncharacterized protein n=1 Tax=Colocasia esculenta TaxID=4460 RepID=A0A843TUI3_COLES|nr:hypothetical protein [Colocasia esculenta]
MVQPTRQPCGNPWSEEIYGGLGEKAPVRKATGRDQKATQGCEHRDGDVRSGSLIATERMSP